ncbi:DUF4012 domain-containing protein [Candidatus Daviesbacteria bacterium]|nr:DUF4012 domain-containing protein [Candidatus Daviesbacteria bacterium]
MEDSANSRIDINSNLVSRNRPVSLVVNACTFLSSHLIDYLLEKNIQVIAIDDLSISGKRNIENAIKNKDFHLLNFPIDKEEILSKLEGLDLPRLDYAFFITEPQTPDIALGKGIINFIRIAHDFKQSLKDENEVSGDKPRLVFSSSINLYGRNLETRERIIKEAEIKFAKGVKHFKLNGRIVRLSEVFGPRMELEDQNPLARLITSTINDKLEDEKVSLVYSERSLFVSDAVKLLVKSALSGSTSNKIFDGTLLHPLKLSDIKQILGSQLWTGENPPVLTRLPAWPSPNLIRTMKELAWSPNSSIVESLKETIAYFKENPELVPKNEPAKKFPSSKSWSFAGTGFLNEEKAEKSEPKEGKKAEDKEEDADLKPGQQFDIEVREDTKKSFRGKAKRFFTVFLVTSILIYGLIWPVLFLSYEGWSIKNHLLASRNFLDEGEFDKAQEEIGEAKRNVSEFKKVLDNAGIIRKIPKISDIFERGDRIVNLTGEGIDGIFYATRGSKSLFETTKVISGESRNDPQIYYNQAQEDLGYASTKLSNVYARLGDESLTAGFPDQIKERVNDLKFRLSFYQSLVEQAKTASILMPEITGTREGKKSYLVLLQNNLELRPGGGFIGSYAKLDFENGILKDIKVDDIYNLDGALKEIIAPPGELKSDLGVERLFLRDSNYEPDFPTSARQASFFYKKEAGESVHGVIALDLKASGNLLDAVGGLDLPEYGEAVNGTNLFEKAVSHAETNFFPGSQAKKNYLTSLQTQLFNKIFYLSKQNWPAIIQALGTSLNEKHALVYLEDPSLFSHLASSNWSGVFPRGSEKREGEEKDFLAVIESNMGANKVNYYIQRKLTLSSTFSKEGKISHKLKINYKNTSPSDVFPGGSYKNRIKIYTPLGSKLIRAQFEEKDITEKFIPFSDYQRSGFSALIQVGPKKQETLIFEYELADPLSFAGNSVLYRMEIFKQPGVMSDPLDFTLTYPINYRIQERPEMGSAGVQEIKIATDMKTDRVFEFKITK